MSLFTKSISPPDLSTLLDQIKRDCALAINCIQIGEIESYSPETQTATIRLAMKQVLNIDEDGGRELADYPALVECPVFTLQGGGDFISFPIKAGDNCIVLFNDRQIDDWANFGPGRPPAVSRAHDLSDGMALVGINPLTNLLSGIISDGIAINHGSGNAKIELKNNLVRTTVQEAEFSENVTIGGNLTIRGEAFGNAGESFVLNADLEQLDGKSIHAGNGATGTFNIVEVVDGIVVGGS